MHDQLIKQRIEEAAEKKFPLIGRFCKSQSQIIQRRNSFIEGANLLSPDLAQALELLEEVTKRYGIEWPDIETLLAKYKP